MSLVSDRVTIKPLKLHLFLVHSEEANVFYRVERKNMDVMNTRRLLVPHGYLHCNISSHVYI